jgi:hypothetical protein
MLSLRPLQRALDRIYRTDVREAVDDFVRPMDPCDANAARREGVLVEERADGEAGISVLLDPRVPAVLGGGAEHGLTRFDAWCLALEGVSHFVLLAHRAANDRPVSQLELELQADVDKFAVALIDRVLFRAPGEAHALSGRLRSALFERVRFLDDESSVAGVRYRLAHRWAARYAASLERRYVREGRLSLLVEELRDFYRASLSTKRAMAA